MIDYLNFIYIISEVKSISSVNPSVNLDRRLSYSEVFVLQVCLSLESIVHRVYLYIVCLSAVSTFS